MPMDATRNRIHIALVPIFFVALWVPALCALLGYDPIPRPNENRNPATFPARPDSLAALQAFPQKFEAYYNDHFGLRNTLVYGYLWTKSMVLGVSPSPLVVVGREDWTYLGHDQQLAASRGTALFSDAQLEDLRRNIENEKAIAERHGARYLRCYGPDKSTIYPEHAPAWLHRISKESNLDQLQAYLTSHSDVTLVDLRPAILKAKADNYLVYLQSNSHWNDYGAYVGYCTIADTIQPWLPNFVPVVPDDLSFSWRPRKPDDLEAEIDIAYYKASLIFDVHPKKWRGKMVGKEIAGLKIAGGTDLSISENENQSLPKLVIFHDSFGWAIAPYFIESFSRVVFVRKPGFSEEIIAKERPDLVITLGVERSLTPVKPHQ